MTDPAPRTRILYVEDEPALRKMLQDSMTGEGYAVRTAESGARFWEALREDPPDLCLLDLELPDTTGLDLLRRLGQDHPAIPAMILTGSDSVQKAVEAMKLGAIDYLTKPFELHRLCTSVENALKFAGYRRTVARLQKDVPAAFAPEHLVGGSRAMEQLRSMIRRAAAGNVNVLILGETGTGKERVARVLHYGSPRRDRPFVDLNCSALTESILESELFGHEKGAFTGAHAQHRGQFEQADGGTLFLDEIGDMPSTTQTKILRVLQEGRFKRVGGTQPISVDVRVFCATHRNLETEAAEGRFRNDLLYRINTFQVTIPPLRERSEDIPELARHFLARASQLQKKNLSRIATPALDLLTRHSWPGNVRELEHAVERAVLMCDGPEILPEHLPDGLARAPSRADRTPAAADGLPRAVEDLERSLIFAALERNGWVMARAARELKITERMISYKMMTLGISKPAK